MLDREHNNTLDFNPRKTEKLNLVLARHFCRHRHYAEARLMTCCESGLCVARWCWAHVMLAVVASVISLLLYTFSQSWSTGR